MCYLNLFKPPASRVYREVRKVASIDIDSVKADLLSDPTLSSRPSADKLFQNLRTAYNRHGRTTRYLIPKRPPSPWYSAVGSKLLELKRKWRRAERKWRATNHHVDRQIFQAAKNHVTSFVQRAKSLYFSSKSLACTTCKQLFRHTHTCWQNQEYFSSNSHLSARASTEILRLLQHKNRNNTWGKKKYSAAASPSPVAERTFSGSVLPVWSLCLNSM